MGNAQPRIGVTSPPHPVSAFLAPSQFIAATANLSQLEREETFIKAFRDMDKVSMEGTAGRVGLGSALAHATDASAGIPAFQKRHRCG